MLRALREKKGWSQKKLAGKVHIDPSTLQKIEAGTRRPSVEVLEALLGALGASHKARSEALAFVGSSRVVVPPTSKAA